VSEGLNSEEGAIRTKIMEDVRPWGSFRRYAYNEKCTVKILTVSPNQRLSKQTHKHRDELWIIIDEGLQVELDNRVWNPRKGEEIVISRNTFHRLSSLSATGRVVEISFGEFDEKDIIRSDDIYGRK
jgi:mannose-6-phosphate isomerase